MQPKQFPKVVKLGMGIVVVIYITMGFLGYLYCRNVCKGSITLNLPGTLYVHIEKVELAIEKYDVTCVKMNTNILRCF